MIRMDQKKEIILMYFREGKSQREISRILGVNRKTVAKYVKMYEEAMEEYEKVGSKRTQEELVEKIVGKPKYNSSNRKPRKVTNELVDRIKGFIETNEIKIRNGKRKQIMPVTQMYEIIHEEGYDVSIGTVYNVVRKELLRRKNEGYIKQKYKPGEIVEFDWGEIKIAIKGTNKKIQVAVFTFAYSNYRYAILYEKQNMESFIDAHIKFFEYIKGVNHTIVYDNMKVAIKKFVGKNDREITDDLSKLSMHYKFHIRFCNVRKPNEKGHVEKSVDVIKKRVFSIKDEFETLDEAKQFLEMRIKYLNENMKNKDRVSPKEIFENDEKPKLIYKPPRYAYSIIKDAYVDKYSTITINNCHYSVPTAYVGKWIKVKLYPEKIVIYDGRAIEEHERVYGNNIWKIKIEHYLGLLKRKPGALHNSLALHQAPQKIKTIYQHYFITKPKEFIMLLEYIYENKINVGEIEEILKKLEQLSPKDISFAKVKILYENKRINKKIEYHGAIEDYSRRQLIKLKEMINS
ncbi:transposase [Marinitoga sp. 1155]|nr:transposase [Marinitoga sp. 1155]